jgi:hypothetical protein
LPDWEKTTRLLASIRPGKIGKEESCARMSAQLAEEESGADFYDLTAPDKLSVNWTDKIL